MADDGTVTVVAEVEVAKNGCGARGVAHSGVAQLVGWLMWNCGCMVWCGVGWLVPPDAIIRPVRFVNVNRQRRLFLPPYLFSCTQLAQQLPQDMRHERVARG